MYLQRLEILGFKSFAHKTVLEFVPPRNNKKGIVAVVGPNGAGKSNIADAIRWVLGEQSMKALRGKKGEDVIFAGSDKKARMGLAEVSIILNNQDMEAPIEFSEVTISRRLYRDGDSEYLINGHVARLQDIALLLARARFGQKNYLVIGQGMADAILRASALERKEFFDEAAGVKEFQIKRQSALSKLEATHANLEQADGLVREIEPRLKSLNRQVKRLAEREAVEGELRSLQKKYYNKLWRSLAERKTEFEKQYARVDEDLQKKKKEQESILARFRSLEENPVASQAFMELQKQYEEQLAERNSLQDRKFKLQSQFEMARVRAEREKVAVPLPLESIISKLEELLVREGDLLNCVIKVRDLKEIVSIQDQIEKLKTNTGSLITSLKNPAGKKIDFKPDPVMLQELAQIDQTLMEIGKKLTEINRKMQEVNAQEKQKKGEFFELQRVLQGKQMEVHAVEQQLNSIQIELAKVETKREGLEEEIKIEMGGTSEVNQRDSSVPEEDAIVPEELHPQIIRLKHQLELIGGIDPEAVAEHKETQERFDFLTHQITDLRQALEHTIQIILDLDKVMKDKRAEALQRINEEFEKFFKLLFNGGAAKIIPLYETPVAAEQASENGDEEQEEEQKETNKKPNLLGQAGNEPVLVGVEINATPPGKRIKDINILSGGERALTSVALICAILAYSPSPFVVLDEVDAPLDEANSIRYAEILDQLSHRTQFIVVTHNRATMHKSSVLYGVTMGDEGVSKMLSVKLEEAEKIAE